MAAEGFVKGGKIDLPFEINGTLVRVADASKVLRPIDARKRSLFETKRVIVYGPASCPRTEAFTRDLEKGKIPYTLLDPNGPARGEFEAKIDAHLGAETFVSFPVVDTPRGFLSVKSSSDYEKALSLAR